MRGIASVRHRQGSVGALARTVGGTGRDVFTTQGSNALVFTGELFGRGRKVSRRSGLGLCGVCRLTNSVGATRS